tara:strand:+ start:18549 stop:18737 length:189 start_codon:yes stop_codon:yes gene_type:complete
MGILGRHNIAFNLIVFVFAIKYGTLSRGQEYVKLTVEHKEKPPDNRAAFLIYMSDISALKNA